MTPGTQRAKRIDGRAIAAKVRAEVAQGVRRFQARTGTQPCLATLLVGDDPASAVYVRSKHRASEKVGIQSQDHRLRADVTEDVLAALVDRLAADPTVHGLLIQLPLPTKLNTEAILDRVPPEKDVDGFHLLNLGKLLTGQPGLRACTPLGIMRLLREAGAPLDGAQALVIGRSRIVGKPIATLLLEANATVTIAHSHTQGLQTLVEGADILVAALGRPEAIPGAWVKEGAYVIDVGMNRNADGTLVGDVAFEAASARAAAITPVPGGVGPMTIAMLLSNTLDAARAAHNA